MHMKKLNDIKMGVNLIEYCLSYLPEDDVKGQKNKKKTKKMYKKFDY